MKKHVVVNVCLGVMAIAAAGGIAARLILTRQEPDVKLPRRIVPRVRAPRAFPVADYQVRVVGLGQARPKFQVTITPQVAGKVVDRAPNFIRDGHVRAGQMLYQIERTDYEIARESALRTIESLQSRLNRLGQEEDNLKRSLQIEADRLALAQRQLDKARRLLARNAAGQDDVDSAEEFVLARRGQLQTVQNQLKLIRPQKDQLAAEIEAAKVNLRSAEVSLARTTVRNPIGGRARVLECDLDVGEVVQPGVPCGELYGTDLMEVSVSIPPADLRWIDHSAFGPGAGAAAGEAARPQARLAWLVRPTVTWRGTVERIGAGLDPQTRTARLIVEVSNRRQPDAGSADRIELGPNMFCRVTVLGKVLAKVFVLERSAIQPNSRVYVIERGRLAERRVKVERYTQEKVLILPGGGIGPGDRVVIDAIPKPVIGMRIEPLGVVASGPATAPAGEQR